MKFRSGATRAAIVALAAVLVADCSSSRALGARTTTLPTTTTSAPGPAPYAREGPSAVGVTTLRITGGRRVVVWYPAAPGASQGHQQESIDLAALLTPALQAKIPAADRAPYLTHAYQDAPPQTAPGHYPLILFSHGYAGYPEQSVSLTTHLASWGFVVAAPDHVERSLDGLLGTAATGVPKMTDVAVLQATLDAVEQAAQSAGLLHGLVDPDRVVAAGHSAGASATYALASVDTRIKAWIAYSVEVGGKGEPTPTPPPTPGMVMLGTADGIIPPSSSEQVYSGMRSPKYLVRIGGAGHLVFSDICLIDRSAGGVTGIAAALKLPIPPSLLKLGSDGCGPNYPPAERAFPAIDQLSVAFFRWALHIDSEPVGLSSRAVANLGADVVVASA